LTCIVKILFKNTEWKEGRRSGEVDQTMYTHVSKCKNDKIKERKKQKQNTELIRTQDKREPSL
jgi:hypothetical protein